RAAAREKASGEENGWVGNGGAGDGGNDNGGNDGRKEDACEEDACEEGASQEGGSKEEGLSAGAGGRRPPVRERSRQTPYPARGVVRRIRAGATRTLRGNPGRRP
ncbi:MAG: hypothetical protein ABI364_04960, partial [Caldimonas sp.]